MKRFALCVAWLALFGLASFTGCQAEKTAATGASESEHDHDHDHDHDHGPAGPHGGHTEKFDQSGYTFEWIHDDASQLVKVVILDEAQKNAVPVKAESLTMTSSAGQSPQTFTLNAVSPDEEGQASEFEIKDGALIVALGLGVDIAIDIDGTEYTKKLEPHEHHDH